MIDTPIDHDVVWGNSEEYENSRIFYNVTIDDVPTLNFSPAVPWASKQPTASISVSVF